MVEGLVCLTLAVRLITLQTTPQRVERVSEYQSCQAGNIISIQSRDYFRVDGKSTTAGETADVLWSLDLGPEDGSPKKD